MSDILEAFELYEYTGSMNATLEHDLYEQLERLSLEAQIRVLAYTR